MDLFFVLLQLLQQLVHQLLVWCRCHPVSEVDGMVVISDLDSAIPSALKKKVKKLQSDLASGKVHAFTGPIYDQKGNLMVAEGKTADDGMLAGMMTYVK